MTQPNKELLAFRAPRALADEVRRLADRDGETGATILRKLVRLGLDHERERRSDSGEAA